MVDVLRLEVGQHGAVVGGGVLLLLRGGSLVDLLPVLLVLAIGPFELEDLQDAAGGVDAERVPASLAVRGSRGRGGSGGGGGGGRVGLKIGLDLQPEGNTLLASVLLGRELRPYAIDLDEGPCLPRWIPSVKSVFMP